MLIINMGEQRQQLGNKLGNSKQSDHRAENHGDAGIPRHHGIDMEGNVENKLYGLNQGKNSK